SFTPDLKNGLSVYEICATCHLPEGWGNDDGGYPQIAGQHKNVLIKQLLDIRSGYRDNPAMYPFVQERTIGGNQALADVVAYISTLPMNPRHRKGPWSTHRDEYLAGKKMYRENCSVCHGNGGEGNDEKTIPLLYGQHYPYLLRQVRQIKSGQRKVNPTMQAITKKLSDVQIQQILDYVSYLPVPDGKRAPSLNWRNTDFY
ncbi:MAG TPA: c-type cytochrome, partial [Gammaproteobacteria bacterium]|nr:c-type cytochrome [Gammaproteobacteria bacterium]